MESSLSLLTISWGLPSPFFSKKQHIGHFVVNWLVFLPTKSTYNFVHFSNFPILCDLVVTYDICLLVWYISTYKEEPFLQITITSIKTDSKKKKEFFCILFSGYGTHVEKYPGYILFVYTFIYIISCTPVLPQRQWSLVPEVRPCRFGDWDL